MRLCDVDRCERPHRARGLCAAHYQHWRRTSGERPRCAVGDCERPMHCREFCSGHYQRFVQYGTPLAGRPITERCGRHLDADGYTVLYQPGHPNAFVNGSVFEHTVVMSQKLGRPLRKGETVHHRNGKRSDNRPENLELWSGAHPRGARVADHINWALEVLERYGNDADLYR